MSEGNNIKIKVGDNPEAFLSEEEYSLYINSKENFRCFADGTTEWHDGEITSTIRTDFKNSEE